MCQKWFAKFHAGNFSLDDAPWLDRPIEGYSNQIRTLIGNSQCYTMWEIETCIQNIQINKVTGEMKNVPFILQKTPYEHFGQPNITLP